MKSANTLIRQAVTLALSGALLTTAALAQEAASSDTTSTAGVALEEVIVTGVASPQKLIDTSVSVTSVDLAELLEFAPRNTAEIFHNVPGVRVESSGGEGNANLTIRGVPVASGGAKYVQLHEDGLPVLEFGDIAFANADIFLRNDYTLAQVQAIRGGSASTFASNSPAGVINFISKTGTEEGGSVGLSLGLDYRDLRTDFDFGGHLNDNTRFNVGGFFREGRGPRDPGYNGNSGGQIKANLTREFDHGYVRVYFKHLDDQAISYMPMPVRATGSNSHPSLGGLAGYDSSKETLQSAYFISDLSIGTDGNRRLTDIRRGMNPQSSSFGAELSFDLGDGWNLNNKIRKASNSGLFVSPFPAEVGSAQSLANSTVDLVTGSTNATGATITYANGPKAGQAFNTANGLAVRVHLFNTELNDLGNFINDFKLAKSFGDTTTLTVGYYLSKQNIDMSWLWNSYLMEVKGDNAALLNVRTAGGTSISQNGLYAYGVPYWGNCCQRHYDATYDTRAPYANLALTFDNLNVDLSVRRDMGDASGTYTGGVQSRLDVNNDGVIQATENSVSVINNAAPAPINYGWRYTSYSAGANYKFNADNAVFGRISRGARANADRLLFTPFIRSDGSAVPGLSSDQIDQIEVGYKWRGDGYALFATAFHTKTQEQANFEATTQRIISQDYKSQGLELEASADWGDFGLSGNLTWTDAEIASGTSKGKTPRRQPTLLYGVTPAWHGSRFTVGANLFGVSSSYAQDDNVLKMPGYMQVNAFVEAKVTGSLTASLNVNNLFDTFAITETEDSSLNSNGIIRARPINPRSTSLTLSYKF